ncbi:MAG: transcription-repair coupling factor [Actinomycetes bacterium]|jgi:transcription-repair coupling factor (superfamily II helicase)|nr:transcription-repair coupling factor [Actinomycetes bacterium]
MTDAREQLLERLCTGFNRTGAAQDIAAALAHGSDASLNIPSFIRAEYLAADFLQTPASTFVVTPTHAEADRLVERLRAWLGPDRVLLADAGTDLPWTLLGPDADEVAARARVLHALADALPVIVVADVTAAMRKVPSKDKAWFRPLEFAVGTETIPLQNVAAQLVGRGYRRQNTANEPGAFALHGDVLSIYPPWPDRPVRVDYFDDEIEALRTFIPGSGQVAAALDRVSLYPIAEPNGACVPLAGYVSASARVVVSEPKALFDCATKHDQKLRDSAQANNWKQPLDAYFVKPAQLDFGGTARLTLRTLAGSTPGTAALRARRPNPAATDDALLISIRELLKKQLVVTLALPDRRHRERVGDLLVFAGITIGEAPGAVRICDLDLPGGGFVAESAGLAVLTTAEIYPRAVRNAARSASAPAGTGTVGDVLPPGVENPQAAGAAIDPTKLRFSFEPGDYVVHAAYGIALFRHIERREVEGVTRDYLVLQYAEGDVLYTPVEQIDKVSKYVGADGSAPRVTRLGTKSWARATAKAREAARRLAFDLTKLYSRRSHIRGFAFGPDTEAQARMEAGFAYTPTRDQLAAIADVKADMQSARPMDRLIIGDVGYGKTEVAIRAAFKAACDGKQTLVLCPTTILAQQHFSQFSERFAPFGVTVEVLSRFRTPAQSRAALEAFKSGELAVLVGTHRLLSADVEPHDLGLLVIDEEQRFGVEHKEQLKNMREQIDVLALSATPIPRTLQMSLSGVRDLSVIDTPPEGRHAVSVHVGAYQQDLVQTAIRNELARHGQVYYVSNRVRTIDDAVQRVHAAVPEARVAFVHGQMSEHQLEEVMEAFAACEVDVLVATTIVESGLDNPHTNTLIIEDSQRLGLAQLYQLKGRVGRSHRRAYAYFLYPPTEPLTPEAVERLSAIAEHDELGAGIKIAMRDLEIRGAGSIIGAAQSGQLAGVGFDLFAGMLQTAIEEAHGVEHSAVPDIRVDIRQPAYLPEEYIPDLYERVLWYRRIAAAPNTDALAVQLQECTRTYGAPPAVALTVFLLAEIRLLAAQLHITAVECKAPPATASQSAAQTAQHLDLKFTKVSTGMAAGFREMGVYYLPAKRLVSKRLECGENVAVEARDFLRAIVFDDARD